MNTASLEYEPQVITLELLRTAAKATPPDKPREIRDNRNHLILRHQPTGYLGLYVELGRGRRERLCDARTILDSGKKLTLGKVKKRAESVRGQSADGRDFQAERAHEASIPALEDFLDKTYLPWLHLHRRSGDATVARIKSSFADFLNKRLDSITPEKLEPWKARRAKKVTNDTINRDIAALRAALGRAARLKILASNPLDGVEMMSVDRNKQVVRALTAAEKGRLIEALVERDDAKRVARANGNQWRSERGYTEMPGVGKFSDTLTPAVIVSLETGLRRGELFALQWPSVDFKAKTLRVEGDTAKTFETREIPLNQSAVSVLRDWWLQMGQPGSGYVFSQNDMPIQDLKKSYHKVLQDAGIKRRNAKGQRVTWHSLRHTFGTLLGAANVDPTTLMKLMGHAKLSTTQRYLHTDEDRKRAAVELLEAVS